MEALAAPPEPPAGAGESDAPGRGADRGQHGVADEGHPEDPGRDGDERAGDGRHAAEEDGPVLPAVEPAPRFRELPLRDAEPLVAVAADRPADDRPEQVADRPRERHREVGVEPGRDSRAEERDMAREDTRGEGARVD